MTGFALREPHRQGDQGGGEVGRLVDHQRPAGCRERQCFSDEGHCDGTRKACLSLRSHLQCRRCSSWRRTAPASRRTPGIAARMLRVLPIGPHRGDTQERVSHQQQRVRHSSGRVRETTIKQQTQRQQSAGDSKSSHNSCAHSLPMSAASKKAHA